MSEKPSEKMAKVRNLKITVDATKPAPEPVILKTKSAPSNTDFTPVEDLEIFDDRIGEGVELGENIFAEPIIADDSDDVRFHVNLDRRAEEQLFGPDQDEQDLFGIDEPPTIASSAPYPFRNYRPQIPNFDLSQMDRAELESPENQAKRVARAKRFGTEGTTDDVSISDEKLRSLYESFGLDPGIGEKRTGQSEKYRLDAIFVRGVDDMNTRDIFHYFSDFGAEQVDWINDKCCNVVFKDRRRAGKALLSLSRPLKRIRPPKSEQEEGEVSSDEEQHEDQDQKEFASPMKKKKTSPDAIETILGSLSRENQKIDDEDVLMLSLDEENVMKEIGKKEKPEDQVFCVDEEEPIEVEMRKHSVPPGRWRVGSRPYDKSDLLLFRYATINDVKLPGAQHESNFYKKYGNPNFGGLPGLISRTRKRQMGMAPPDFYPSRGEPRDLRKRLDSRKIIRMRNRTPSPVQDRLGYPEDDSYPELREPDELEEPRPKVKQPPKMKMRADDEEQRMRRRRSREDVREWSPSGGRSTPPAFFEDWDAPGGGPGGDRGGFTGGKYTVGPEFDYSEEFLKDEDREKDLPEWGTKRKWTPPSDLKRMKVTVENS